MAPLTPASNMALTQLSARTTLPVASQVAIKLAYFCLVWSQRSRTRQTLRNLPDAALRDIGLTPNDAYHERRKWFWRP